MRPLLALFAFAALLSAQSQQPSPAKTKESGSKQEETTSKQERVGTQDGQAKSGAVVINQYYYQPKDRDNPKGDDRENDKSSTKYFLDVVLAISTFLLFLATVALCVIAAMQWQTMKAHKQSLEAMAGHMETGLKDTTTAATAASVSADTAKNTFVSSHRPRLTIRFMSADGIEQVNPISGRFFVFNTGGTNARLTRAYSELVIYPAEQLRLPASTPYEGKIVETVTDIELPPGGHTVLEFPTSGPTEQPGSPRDYDLQRHGHIYVIGWIEYTDAAQRVHRMGFARQYDRKDRRFNRETDEDYEYDD